MGDSLVPSEVTNVLVSPTTESELVQEFTFSPWLAARARRLRIYRLNAFSIGHFEIGKSCGPVRIVA
jgi:hypothetical protein